METDPTLPYSFSQFAHFWYTRVARPIRESLIDKLTSSPEFSLRNGFTVIVVDMQTGFLDDFDDKMRRRLIQSHFAVLEYCVKYDVPTAILEYAERGRTILDLCDVIERVPRHSYFIKRVDDGFSLPELKLQLEQWGNYDLLMMGINGSGCVLRTAESAVDNQFKVYTAESLTGDPLWLIENPSNPAYRRWFKENGVYRRDHNSFLRK
ncbi:isochorismatase family protein [Candidatus Woesearchaeota archaeon]|nr:isochorismatase family protein [Candidatus Woesearchaeota archaeon]